MLGIRHSAKAGIQVLSRFSGPFVFLNMKHTKSTKASKTCSRSEWQEAGEDSRREKTGQPQLFLLRGGDGRDVAQPGRALRSGRRGRWFESSRPDHVCLWTLNQLTYAFPNHFSWPFGFGRSGKSSPRLATWTSRNPHHTSTKFLLYVVHSWWYFTISTVMSSNCGTPTEKRFTSSTTP